VPTFVINSPWDSWQLACEFTATMTPQSWDPNATTCASAPGWEACGHKFEQCNATQMGPFNDYAASMLKQFQGISKFEQDGNGAFLHSCEQHMASLGTDWVTATIRDKVFRFAFEDWWFGNFGMPGDSIDGKGTDRLQPAKEHTYLPRCTLKDEPPHWCNPTCSARSLRLDALRVRVGGSPPRV